VIRLLDQLVISGGLLDVRLLRWFIPLHSTSAIETSFRLVAARGSFLDRPPNLRRMFSVQVCWTLSCGSDRAGRWCPRKRVWLGISPTSNDCKRFDLVTRNQLLRFDSRWIFLDCSLFVCIASSLVLGVYFARFANPHRVKTIRRMVLPRPLSLCFGSFFIGSLRFAAIFKLQAKAIRMGLFRLRPSELSSNSLIPVRRGRIRRPLQI
jgi:hypothetical protein